ncbi:MAG: hypothetical protein WC365_03680 [Candidatus Babeliales bacterium]
MILRLTSVGEMGIDLQNIRNALRAIKSRLPLIYTVNIVGRSLKMPEIYHTDNTAEAAYMLLKGIELHHLELNEDDGKVTIVLKDNELLGEHIINWPHSPEFKYYASFNLLTIKIKRLLNGNYKKATS